MSTKKVIIGCCGCTAILVLLGVAGFLGFGTFTLNGDCVFKGPLASASEGPCAGETTNTPSNNQQTSTDKTFTSNNGYSFNYPTSYTVEELGDEVYVYSGDEDPEFSDNMSIYFGDYDYLADEPISRSFCQSYADDITGSYVGDVLDSSVRVVNLPYAGESCKLEIDGDVQGYEVTQVQYVVKATAGRYYIITVSVLAGSSNLSDFIDIAESFKL
ncbi:hypothetical protein KC640_01585 [Candidatus Dojkabacteria bacterium]|uniref:Uncharacterized protein n=1 Tax=Candidatus Dojkabacteria bacterium TaxID=2099670 RepID=A0A955L053_9BACT|nr:hypothetical protein [Candidatus Dojkabacteria bacterium]